MHSSPSCWVCLPVAARCSWRRDSMQIQQRVCIVNSDELEHEGIPPARSFVATQSGRPTLTGCWALDIAGDVILRDLSTTADALPVSMGWFKRESGR